MNKLIVIGALVQAFAAQVSACSLAGCLNDGPELRRNFVIAITHGNKPLPGVGVTVTRKGVDRFAETNGEGIVRLSNLSPGLYWLKAEFLGTGVAYDCFHVSNAPTKAAKSRLSYTWGDDAPSTSKIAGRLIDSQPGRGGTPIWNLTHRVDVPIVGAGLKLQDPLSRASYVAQSDQNGHFSFEGLPNGVYVLHIEGGAAGDRTYDPTDVVVRLNADTAPSSLLFKRREDQAGSCGGTELELQVPD